MMKKRLSKTLWYGSDIDKEGKPVLPPLVEDANDLEGIHKGELYLHLGDGSALLFTRSADGQVVQLGSNKDELANYLLKSVWDKAFEIRTTENGEEYLFTKLNLATQYGITIYANGGLLDLPNIFEGLPIDNDTIYWDGEVLKSRGVGEGGVTPTLLGDLKNVGAWANGVATEDRIMVQKKGSSSWESFLLSEIKGSASFENVKESGEGNAFTSFVLSEDKKTLTFVKDKTFAEKSNTLSGYGITDAYTKTEADNLLAKKWTQDDNKITNWDAAFGWGDHSKANYATKSSTLSGYGITDAYTSKAVDELLSGYLPLEEGGTIAGDLRLQKNGEWTSTYLYFGDNKEVYLVEESDQELTIHANKRVILGSPVTYIDGDLVVKGGVTMFANEGEYTPSTITQAVNVDGITIVNDGTKIMLNPNLELGGGLDEEKLETYLNQNQYAKKSDIDTRISNIVNGAPEAYDTLKEIADVLDKNVDSVGDIINTLGSKADKSTTISGYGITDAYTKNNIDSLLSAKWTQNDAKISNWDTAYSWGNHAQAGYFKSADFTKNKIKTTLGVSDWALASTKPSYTTKEVDEDTNLYFTNQRAVSALAETLKDYVTLSGTQTIAGEKNFTGGLKVNGQPIVYNSDGYWLLDGDLIVTGGVTMFANENGYTPSTITDAVSVDNITIIRQDGKLMVNPELVFGGGGGEISSVAWGNVLGKPSWITDTKPEYKYSEIKETPNLGEYAKKGTTLSAYGITDAYTKTDTDNKFLLKSSYTADDILTKLKSVDGSKSGLDADKLDGQEGSYYASASSLANYLPLSGGTLTNELTGTTIIANDLYWSIGKSKTLSATGWYRFATSERSDASGNTYILSICRNYTYNNNESYLIAVALDYSGCSFTQLAGHRYSAASQLVTKIRCTRTRSGSVYFDFYYNGTSQNTMYVNAIGHCKVQTPTATSSTLTYTDEFSLEEGVKSSLGFVGDLNGNADTATKLKTTRTLWGQSFDGSADIKNASIALYKNESSYTVGWARSIYSTNSEGTVLSSFGFYGQAESLNYAFLGKSHTDTTMVWLPNGNVGVGITNPSYKFDVNGSMRIQGTSIVRNTRPELTNSYSLGDSSYLWANIYTKKANIDGIEIKKSKDGVLYIGGNLVVSGGVTMYGTDGTTANTIWDSAPIASTSVKGIASFDSNYFAVNDGKVTFVGQTGGGVADSVAWGNVTGKPTWLGSSKPSYTTSEVAEGTNLYFTNARAVSALSSTLSNYLTLSGGTINGGLTIKPTNIAGVQDGIVLHDGGYGSGESLKIKWTSESYKTGLSLCVQQNNESLLFENSKGYHTIWHSGNDGASSGLDADKLDGQEGSYYASASSLANYLPLSGGTLTNELTGTTIIANDLYWSIGKSKTLSATGWYRFATSERSDASGNTYILSICRNYAHNSNESYLIAVTLDYSGCSFTQLAGHRYSSAAQLVTKIRCTRTRSGSVYFDFYYNGTSQNTMYVNAIGHCKVQTPTATSSTLTYTDEFSLEEGVKSSLGFVGDLNGNADTATTASKLSTVSKTAWGQTYWTSGGVPTTISGNMSSVGNITSLANGTYDIGSSSNKWKDLWVGNVKYTDTMYLGFSSSYASIRVGGSGSQLIVDSTSVRTNSTASARASLGTNSVPWNGLYIGVDASSANNIKGINFCDVNGDDIGHVSSSNTNIGIYTIGSVYLRGGCTKDSNGAMVASKTGVVIDKEGNVTIGGNLLVSGGITMYASTLESPVESFYAKEINLEGSSDGRHSKLTNEGDYIFTVPVLGEWHSKWDVCNSDGETILGSAFGVSGDGDTLNYFYYGGTYDNPWLTLKETTLARKYWTLNDKDSNPYLKFEHPYNDVIYKWYIQGYKGYLYLGSTSSQSFRVSSDGSIYTPKTLTQGSDIRYKDVHKDLVLSLKEMSDAPSLEFHFKDDESKTTHLGTSAQYWQFVDGVVSEDSEGRLGMDYSSLGVVMGISLAKELSSYESVTDKEIRELKKRIGELEEEIENLKNK